MKKIYLGIIVICICSMYICSCQKERKKEEKDKFIGIWISWDDTQKFMVDEYVQEKYIDKIDDVIQPTLTENGLYIFSYIIYDGDDDITRETVASRELVLEDTVNEEDRIYNHAYVYRNFDACEKMYFTKIYEKSDGTIYYKEDTKTEYYSQYDIEQTKQFVWDKCGVDITFVSVDKLDYIVMSEYTMNDKLVDKLTIENENMQDEYSVSKDVKYIEFEEFYIGKNGEKFSKKNFDTFNSDGWVIKYNCIRDIDGIGWKYNFNVVKK